MVNNPELLAHLKRHGAPFVLIGGHAVNFHGHIRATEDTDLVWQRTAESEQALFRALAEIDAQYFGSGIDPVTRIERTINVTLSYIQCTHLMILITRLGFLDLFDFIPGFPLADVSELFATSIESDGLRYASLDWLRQMKKASGRPKDLLDLENLPE